MLTPGRAPRPTAAARGSSAPRQTLRAAWAGHGRGGPRVVLLGRPYAVLAPAMNKGIPDIFAYLGVKAFFQDMLPRKASPAVRELTP